MTRRINKRLAVVGLILALALAAGGVPGCKKAAKKDDGKSAKATAAQSMDAPMGTGLAAKDEKVAKDGKLRGAVAKPAAPAGGVPAAVAPSSGTAAAPPTGGPPRVAAGPVKVQLVLGLNAAKLRRTFLWNKLLSIEVVKTFLAGETYGRVKKALGKDPLLIVDSARVVLGGQSLQDLKKPEHLALQVSGRFDAAATLKKLLTIPVKPGGVKPVLTTINGKVALRGVGKKGDAFALVAVSKDTLAVCSASMLDIVTKGVLTGGDAALDEQLKAVDTRALAWLVFGSVQVPLGSAGSMPALSALSKIRGGSVVLDADKAKWKVVNRLDVTTAQAASSLVQFVNMMKMALDQAGGRPGAPPAALAAVLKTMNVSTQGQIVIASIHLPESAIGKLLDSLIKKI